MKSNIRVYKKTKQFLKLLQNFILFWHYMQDRFGMPLSHDFCKSSQDFIQEFFDIYFAWALIEQ